MNKDYRTPKERKDLIYGVRSIIEAIKAERDINKILILKGMNKDLFLELKETLKGKNYPLQFVPVQKLDALTSGNHQGVVAFISPIEYADVESFIDEKIEKNEKVSILVLDRITDVRNFGAVARTAECMGVDALVVSSSGNAMVNADAVKTSAGALNRIKVCRTDNIKNALFYMQQSGIRVVACTEKSKIPLNEVNLRGSVAIVMGSEENGITQDILNMADIKARIPMKGEIGSLNVSVASGMVLYEKHRQELNG
jgi:23S rRNA (guanosine2251-2'-O)-methyltransferase